MIVDEAISFPQHRKLVLSSGNRGIFRVLTKEIFLPGIGFDPERLEAESAGPPNTPVASGSEGAAVESVSERSSGLNIVLLGLKPGRAKLRAQVSIQ